MQGTPAVAHLVGAFGPQRSGFEKCTSASRTVIITYAGGRNNQKFLNFHIPVPDHCSGYFDRCVGRVSLCIRPWSNYAYSCDDSGRLRLGSGDRRGCNVHSMGSIRKSPWCWLDRKFRHRRRCTYGKGWRIYYGRGFRAYPMRYYFLDYERI